MLEPRFGWHCKPPCCCFMGGTADYDIWMTQCIDRPLDPGVALVASCEDDTREFESREALNRFVDGVACTDPTYASERAALQAAQTFVNTFMPTPMRLALDAMDKGVL